MDTAVNPVQTGRGRRRRWSAEQKLIVLQEWQTRIPLEEICRKYAMNAAQMYCGTRRLDQGLKEPGELVPKSQVLGVQKRVEELERALGRKALEMESGHLRRSFRLALRKAKMRIFTSTICGTRSRLGWFKQAWTSTRSNGCSGISRRS